MARHLERHPGVKATFNLAIALRALGRDDDALEIFDRFLVDHPRDFWAQNYRAWILHDQQRYAESRTGFERALSIDSSHPETEHGLAHSLQGLGLMTEAREHVSLAREGFERTGVQASSNVDTLCDFACVLHQCGDLERASEYYKRAIDLGQTRSASFQKCAEVLRNLGRCEESLQVIDRWIAIAPGDKSAHCQRAWRLVELDRLDEALVSMRCGAEHSHAGPDQNDPVGRWVQEIESLRAHSDLLSGARGPSSADDWVWLSRWNTRRNCLPGFLATPDASARSW
jgi:tetratricopeptide (TPR) repeat protein